AIGLMERLVALGVARGEFEPSAATSLPLVVAGPGLMAALWQIVFTRQRDVPLDAFYEAHVDLVLRGLLKR
ncbi:hypothetical protein ACI4CD_28930, partial [Klebsiella pneumoniae]|uniref:hypothetical protein n=1 Tax=Klebsiella pneumoniae TaxID=573 RepID=UPI003853B39C